MKAKHRWTSSDDLWFAVWTHAIRAAHEAIVPCGAGVGLMACAADLALRGEITPSALLDYDARTATGRIQECGRWRHLTSQEADTLCESIRGYRLTGRARKRYLERYPIAAGLKKNHLTT